ncbi:MAG: thioredoxin family protein [bacterium]|nr:thioredoxin family protein [bacterium]
MDIKVIGTGCEKCGKLYDNVLEALKELGVEEKVERVDDLLEIVKLGVMTAPSLMVDGKLVVSGRIAKVDEIKRFLK